MDKDKITELCQKIKQLVKIEDENCEYIGYVKLSHQLRDCADEIIKEVKS